MGAQGLEQQCLLLVLVLLSLATVTLVFHFKTTEVLVLAHYSSGKTTVNSSVTEIIFKKSFIDPAPSESILNHIPWNYGKLQKHNYFKVTRLPFWFLFVCLFLPGVLVCARVWTY